MQPEGKAGRDLRVSGAIRRGQDYYIKTADRAAHSDGGEMVVLGENPFSPKMKQRIGIMSDMSGLYEKMTVYENLEIFADIYGVERKRERIDEVLAAVELREAKKKKVEKLSRGMKQRLVFARTILHDPELLFLDEPTANLDPTTAQEVRDLIRKLNERGTTVFLTTHNMEEADELCHRVAFLNRGDIVESGTPREFEAPLCAGQGYHFHG